MLLSSTFLLIYTAVIVPVQICMWNYDDPCNAFPMLFFDVFVDAFFMVDYKSVRYHSFTWLAIPCVFLNSHWNIFTRIRTN
jgi:hypothetical protein